MGLSRRCAALVCLLAALLGCRPPELKNSGPGYRQLTFDGGEASSPSLSRDGRFVVYASDRGGGNLNIWMQPVDGGAPVRLTNGSARDYDPVFSADGKTVYFSSLREPNGVYRVPVSGGDAQLVARGGTSAEISLDGQSLLFTNGNLGLLDLKNNSSRPLLANFDNSYAPKWSPDGKEILFAGRSTKDAPVEWWITTPEGATPKRTGLLAGLHARGFSDAFAQVWLPGDVIVFSGKRGDQITLWRVKVSPDRMQFIGNAVRATNDDAGDFHGAYSTGHLVFDRVKVALNLWGLPADANQGKVTGEPSRLTSTDAQKGAASLSRDGRKLLYSAEQLGTFRLVFKDVTSGSQKNVGPSENAFHSVLSADGSRFLYGTGAPGMIDVSSRGVSGWRSWFSRSVCSNCGMPRALSDDGRFLLLWNDTDPGNHLGLLDTQSGKARTIAMGSHFYGPELSPDGGWISFVVKSGEHDFHGYIARIPESGFALESDWIPVNPASHEFQMLFWSPDGNLLYILSEHGEGNLNWLEGQRLDPQSKRPAGQPFTVYHFKEPRVPTMDPIWNHPAAVEGKIVLELGDMSTNVWMMDTAH
jgi:dipeptidyl aminopeptidase/acylaminoacyl peptidase